MSQSRLATLSKVSQVNISIYETTGHMPAPMFGSADRLAAIQAALESAGAIFPENGVSGVKIRPPDQSCNDS